MRTFFYILSVLGAIFAGLFLLLTLGGANGAPQEASGAAIAACIAIIPYVIARSIAGGWAPDATRDLLEKQVEQNKEIITLLRKLSGTLTETEKASLYERRR